MEGTHRELASVNFKRVVDFGGGGSRAALDEAAWHVSIFMNPQTLQAFC